MPAELTDDQVATFFVNPASAIVMTRHLMRVPPGAWLLQTAAGSALGRMVIRLGRREEGLRSLESALREDPHYAPARQALAEFQKKTQTNE